jgi:hypothetical protein
VRRTTLIFVQKILQHRFNFVQQNLQLRPEFSPENSMALALHGYVFCFGRAHAVLAVAPLRGLMADSVLLNLE